MTWLTKMPILYLIYANISCLVSCTPKAFYVLDAYHHFTKSVLNLRHGRLHTCEGFSYLKILNTISKPMLLPISTPCNIVAFLIVSHAVELSGV